MPEAAEITWGEVLSLPGLIGSEIEVRILGVLRRGKIEEASDNGEKIHFKVAADDNDKLGKIFFVNALKSSTPYFLAGRRILFVLQTVGEAMIYLAGGHSPAVN